MSARRWNEDDQHLISYIFNHETLKGTSWKKKHTVFKEVCCLIGRPVRSRNALTSYWTWMKKDGREGVDKIPLTDQARILIIVRISAFSFRLYNSWFTSRQLLLTKLAANGSLKIHIKRPYQRKDSQEIVTWTSKQVRSLGLAGVLHSLKSRLTKTSLGCYSSQEQLSTLTCDSIRSCSQVVSSSSSATSRLIGLRQAVHNKTDEATRSESSQRQKSNLPESYPQDCFSTDADGLGLYTRRPLGLIFTPRQY